MNDKIEKGKEEFDNGNYEKALEYLNDVSVDDIHYNIALSCKIPCLVSLKEYDEALDIINPLISDMPYSEFLWSNKVICHVFKHDDDKAFKALSEVERIFDESDVSSLVFIAKMYNLLLANEKALEYANKALDIDENNIDALHEKTLACAGIGDDQLMSDVADQMLDVVDNSALSRMIIIMLKLLSHHYEDCYNVITTTDYGDLGDDYVESVKGGLFTKICDDLKIDLAVINTDNLDIDDALHLLFEYINTGKDQGSIGDVQYFILQRT